MNNNLNENLNNVQSQQKKKFNYFLGFGIVIGISLLIFVIMTFVSGSLLDKGPDYEPLARFLTSIRILLCIFTMFIGSTIVFIIGLLKK